VGVDLTETRAAAARAAAEWGLTLGEPFALSRYSFVAPAGDAVLKVAWEGDDESLHEAEALELWGGERAVRLLRRQGRALLLERAVPGGDISTLPEEETIAIAVDVATHLWRPARPPFRPVRDAVPSWLENNPSSLTPLAREVWASLEPGADWVVHGDFHHHNILRRGDGYAAIDPKPYLADREYDVFSYLRNPLSYRMVDRGRTERRIAAFAAAGLDDRRIRRWAIVRGAYLTDDEGELALLASLLEI